MFKRAEEGRRKSRLEGQGQQNNEEHRVREVRIGGERKSNKSYLDAGDAPAADKKDDQSADGNYDFVSRKESGGNGVHEETPGLIMEEINVNGKDDPVNFKMDHGNMNNRELDYQAHIANREEIRFGPYGDIAGAHQAGPGGNFDETSKDGAVSEGYSNGTGGLSKSISGKGIVDLGEGMKNKENMERNSAFELSGIWSSTSLFLFGVGLLFGSVYIMMIAVTLLLVWSEASSITCDIPAVVRDVLVGLWRSQWEARLGSVVLQEGSFGQQFNRIRLSLILV
ncbi:hypothetical protein L6452_01616 [Arctium lappa]|uniref:Uncharacterized protein n=1 Tax=Arctium lappa TaxID=4217 RepID=A0ACB9FHD3_ARCLA|nr:hypothetical protein L6452_01616 [Arctium lappa]